MESNVVNKNATGLKQQERVYKLSEFKFLGKLSH